MVAPTNASGDVDRPVLTSINHISIHDTSATTRQIVRACMRCRKQKSKCDPFRPCSVCVKAGVECVSRPNDERLEFSRDGVHAGGGGQSEEPPNKIRKTGSSQLLHHREESRHSASNRRAHRTPSSEADVRISDSALPAVNLTEESLNTQLFTITPGHLMGSLASHKETREKDTNDTESPVLQWNMMTGAHDTISTPSTLGFIDPQYRAVLPWTYSRSSAVSLLAHLPPRPVTDYLIAVYFNTVHWFMVILHEGHFLRHYRIMMDLYAQDTTMISNTDDDFTFAVLVLTVVALGGRYTSTHPARARRCKQIHLDFSRASNSSGRTSMIPQPFEVVESTSKIFSVVRSNATDNLACGTLATVQSQLLLGSLYLFHGDANLARSNSGSIARVAHAVGLHKEHSELHWASRYYQNMELAERRQLRWRLFWAVHTCDRFLAMCYGLPPLIRDEDCVAGIPTETNVYPPPGSSSFLMVEDDLSSTSSTGESAGRHTPTTLLTYQTYKLQFYIILGRIMSSMYKQSHGGFDVFMSKYEDRRETNPVPGSKEKYAGLIATVQDLEVQLRKWHDDLPKTLCLSEDMTYSGCEVPFAEGDDGIIIPESDDNNKNSRNVQQRRLKIKNAIYGMQALLLELAYDNALIMLHRPILAMKDSIPYESFHHSLTACWNSTMRISEIGGHHALRENQQAHAISYIGISLFTSGAVLSAFANSDPLSRLAWEAKRGLNRVIKMQRRLRRKVVVSGQSLAILENLVQELLRKEMNAITAKEMDAEEPVEPPEQPHLSSINDVSPGCVVLDANGNPEESLHCLSSGVQQATEHTQMVIAPISSSTGDLGNNFFQDSILEINESLQDIDRFLTESSFPPLPGFGVDMPDLPMTNDFQQPGLWWFNYDQ